MNPKFERVKRGGYDMEQVDMYINHVRSEYNAVAAAYKEVFERAKVLESEKNDIANVMVGAHTYQAQLKEAAELQALMIIEQSKARAKEIIAEALELACQVPKHKPTDDVSDLYGQAEHQDKWLLQVKKILAPTQLGDQTINGTDNNTTQTFGNQSQNVDPNRPGVSDTNGNAPKLSARRSAFR